MVNFLIVLIPSFLVVAIKWYYYRNRGRVTRNSSIGTIDATELVYSLVIAALVAGASLLLFVLYLYSQIADTEILNGHVTGKKRERVACSHMEECNCRIEKDSQGNNRRKCDQCPEHPYDIDWRVLTSVGSFTIDRVSRRGLEEPPRWGQVITGESASRPHSYDNWLLLDQTSLFVYSVNTEYKLPNYPSVFDYYRFNRVLNYTNVDTSWLNDKLNVWLQSAGAVRQLNVIVVLTNNPEDYFYGLMSYWAGGKKNDLIMVFGLQDSKIVWQRSTTYANGMNNRHLIEEIRRATERQEFNEQLVDSLIPLIESKYTRIEASQFADKAKFIKPPMWLYLLVILINTATSFAVARYFTRR